MGMNLEQHEYQVDEIVIGGSLNALLYAWYTGATLISIDPKEPYFFERFDPSVSLKDIGFENDISTLQAPKSTIEVGIKKSDVWKKIYFLLAMGGQAPIPNSAQSIRIEDDFVKVVTSHSRMARFTYNKLKIFDASQVAISGKKSINRKYKVLDWVWVNTGMIHSLDFIKDRDNFVKEIYFYEYNRRGDQPLKNLVAVSYMTGKELEEYYYSDTYAKFKIEEMMKTAGIKGRKNGYNAKGIPYHLNVKVTPEKREVILIDKYDMEYCMLSEKEILEQFAGPPANKNIQKLLRYW
jgi:hypothetical protein